MKEAEGMDGRGEMDAHTNGATPDERLQHGCTGITVDETCMSALIIRPLFLICIHISYSLKRVNF